MCVDLAKEENRPSLSSTTAVESMFSDQGSMDTDATSPTSPPYLVSKLEAQFYYAGLPSNPLLIYRTGTTPWKRPTGLEAYRELKEIKPVFSHGIVAVWGDLGPKICTCLDSMRVKWTSVDVVRFAKVGKAPGPPVLWIGVLPQSLTGEDAHSAAIGCQDLLGSYEITDIEVEFRESIFTRFAGRAGPKLLKSVSSANATADVRGPLTSALCLRISARSTPHIEGTGALYLSEGRNSDKVYILCARHVVLPCSAEDNKLYKHANTSQPRREVLLLGREAFQTLLKSIMGGIGDHKVMVDYYCQQLNSMEAAIEGDDGAERTEIEAKLLKEEVSIKALNEFHNEVTKYWSEEGRRVLGHITFSPPITFDTGPKGYTEDWALIELDRNKIDWTTFNGNVIDLGTFIILLRMSSLTTIPGTKIPVHKFVQRMYSDPAAPTSFKYPRNRLLPLRGVIEEDEMCFPNMHDADGEQCLIVIKNGCTTGVTIGRATGIKSFVREHFPDGTQKTSKEWAILAYDHESGAFSAPGDSGAIIVDGKGRIGGLLTGGTGQTAATDVTYASPFYWLLQRIQNHFPNAHLYQQSTSS